MTAAKVHSVHRELREVCRSSPFLEIMWILIGVEKMVQ